MAKKLTLFELHFDGANFGGMSLPSKSDSDAETEEEMETEEETTDEEMKSSGRGVGRYAMLLAGVVALGIVGRRIRGRKGSDDEYVYVSEDEESELEIEN